MESHNISNNNIEMWEWREEDFSLQRDPELDIPDCIWDDINQNDNDLLYVLGEHTPMKNCADFDYDGIGAEDNTNKTLEEYRGSSQNKRRRVLQFTSDADDMVNGQIFSASESSKEVEKSILGDELLECLEWDPEWSSSFSDDSCAFGDGKLGQSSEGGSANSLNQSQTQCSPVEMPINHSAAFDKEVEILDFRKMSTEMEKIVVQNPNPAICTVFRGKKSYMKTPTKLTTSVVYPFSLIKPCGGQGDMTLKDINRRLHTPPPSKSKNKDKDPLHCYPTSAYTGKPVVAKTKIHTEGGKGSITIMRTKG
ncbi:protein XRI1-like isoform X1 [Iris pallida]|uniref:Protein XRI1-like isoform X1 n=1 Tax=Iris pallida TaxID=29817 RepID=A0AAX6I015_IRIPA|nr:protein XRI1-like isoform X1 [Iris pallida]